jgi:heme-degrading monooxygenase HmoA
MLVRTWRGATRAEDAETYLDYVRRTGLRAFRETPGNLGALTLRRFTSDGRAEFEIVSFWESMDAVRAFAGPEPEHAVFFPEDMHYLVARDEHVDHFDTLEARWPGPGFNASSKSDSSSTPGAGALDTAGAGVASRRWWEWLVRMA